MPNFLVNQSVTAHVTVTNGGSLHMLASLRANFGAAGTTPSTFPLVTAEQSIPAGASAIFSLALTMPVAPANLGVLLIDVMGRYTATDVAQVALEAQSDPANPVVVSYPPFNLSLSVGWA